MRKTVEIALKGTTDADTINRPYHPGLRKPSSADRVNDVDPSSSLTALVELAKEDGGCDKSDLSGVSHALSGGGIESFGSTPWDLASPPTVSTATIERPPLGGFPSVPTPRPNLSRRSKAPIDLSLVRITPHKQEKFRNIGLACNKFLQAKGYEGRYSLEVQRLWYNHILPSFRGFELPQVNQAILVAFFRHYEDTPALARNLYATLNPFFKWCVQEGHLSANPLTNLQPPRQVPSRETILRDDTLKLLWGLENLTPFYKLLLLTCQRRNEVAGMTWDEISLEGQLWTIPKGRTKNGKEQIVPLPRIVVTEILPPLLAKRGRNPPQAVQYVFGHRRPFQDHGRAQLAILASLPPEHRYWRIHDLRRTGATLMVSRLGVEPHVVERVLNHSLPNPLVGVYQRYEYLKEKREALQKLANFYARF